MVVSGDIPGKLIDRYSVHEMPILPLELFHALWKHTKNLEDDFKT